MNKIVVGVDGSKAARRALAFAIKEAKVRHAEVIAVYAWTHPIVPASIDGLIVSVPNVDMTEEAKTLLEHEIKEVTGGSDEVKVHKRFIERPAATALLRASEDADLLAIGSRGLGGFSGLLLGSVGHQCAQHAKCPVVIVPHEERQ